MGKNYQKRKGSILAFSLLIIGVMFAIALSMSFIATTEKKDAVVIDYSTQAYQAADSGAQNTLQTINAKILTNHGSDKIITDFPNCANSSLPDGSISGANYKLVFYSSSDGSGSPLNCNTAKLIDIKSLKSVGTLQGTVRAINISVKLNCSDACCGQSTYTDVRGTESITYPIVSIGTGSNARCWFKQNLQTTKKPDGTSLVSGTDYFCPPNATNSGSDCSAAITKIGYLYSWNATMNGSAAATAVGAEIQGLCPTGWHVPSDFSGSGNDDIGLLSTVGLAKDENFGLNDATYWSSITGFTNSTGFSGVGAGEYKGGTYAYRGTYGLLWTSSEASSTTGIFHGISSYGSLGWDTYFQTARSMTKSWGVSVRCVMN